MLRSISLGLLILSFNTYANPFATKLTANTKLTNFTDSEQAKMQRVIKKLLKVLNSEQLKNKIINHQYEEEKTFVDNNGMTNLEIYQKLIDGTEELQNHIDNEMDLDLNMYYSLSSTIGYTYPDTLKIWINRRFFRGFKPSQVAANLIHEYMHKLGFGHDYNYTERRKFSVPYALGGIIKKLVEQADFAFPYPPSNIPPVYFPGDINNPNSGSVISNPWQTPMSKNEESQDRFDQLDMTNLPDHYMGPCTDHPND
jgi:hypothetical protein